MVKGLPTEWGIWSCTVVLDNEPLALSYWNNTIGVGSVGGDIIILDVIIGRQTAVLSGHTHEVNSLTFSSDGLSIVSGSNDYTIKLWDIQTGGVIRTFHGHTKQVQSVSISVDYTRIASGSQDETIRLWDIQTGECHHIINQQANACYVSFSPTDPQHLIFISEGKVYQQNINDDHIMYTYDGSHAAFSLDGAQVVLCDGEVVTVQNSNSGAIITKFHVANGNTKHCCFSPDGRLVAVAAGSVAYVWDITSSDPCLIKILVGHLEDINALAFSSPSSLISVSNDKSVKFWQISTPSPDPTMTDVNSTSLIPASIKSITLQVTDGIAISSDSAGVVKTWDIFSGLCKASFQTPAKRQRDIWLIGGRLIAVWFDWKIGTPGKVEVWDVEKGEHLQTLGKCWSGISDIRISGDGSMVFLLDHQSIQAWSIETGKAVGEVKVEKGQQKGSLIVDGSMVWLSASNHMRWDFGSPGLPIIPSANISLNRHHFKFFEGTMQNKTRPFWIEDTVTRRLVFHLPGRLLELSTKPQWDGSYLVVGDPLGEVLILDFGYVCTE